ncbi:MAG: rhomboid family intramembrane serine protease [Ginsengibacter sp.]
MGESERYLERKLRKFSLGDDNNALMGLVAVNSIIFVMLGLIQVIYLMSDSTGSAFSYEILRWVILPAKMSTLSTMPWTVVSYMFVHTGFFYMLITMLWLWTFGSILQTLTGNRKIIPVYIYGGIIGAILFVAASYAIPVLRDGIEYSSLLGCNASIMAIAVAATTLAPKYKLFPMLNGGIPLWVLTVIYVLIDVSGGGGMAVHIAHLGGGLAGYIFVVFLNRGYDGSNWMNDLYSWFMNLFNPDKKKIIEKQTRDKLFYNTRGMKPFVKSPIITQQAIDEILDKINQKGYQYLSDEEKSILQKAGETDF